MTKADGSKDDYLVLQSTQLHTLLEWLRSQWTSKSITLLRFAYAQWQFLELLARLDWLESYSEMYMTRGMGQEAPPVSAKIMGAFSDNNNVVNRLFYVGIPVWYAGPISQALDAHIDCVEFFIKENPLKQIQLHCGYTVDTEDTHPLHPVIYTGLANKPEQY
ncbi:hypothetical protein L218DRAFT_1009027 [Marasmius fiardii PR-910]|nr:hypothetical protein L218DRAFT_1009027 [Marasmius fiardii PR-910]